MKKKKEKTEAVVSKYAKLQNALSDLVENVGDRKEARKQIGIIYSEMKKNEAKFVELGFSAALQKELLNRIANAHSQNHKDILTGSAMGLSLIMQQIRIW